MSNIFLLFLVALWEVVAWVIIIVAFSDHRSASVMRRSHLAAAAWRNVKHAVQWDFSFLIKSTPKLFLTNRYEVCYLTFDSHIYVSLRFMTLNRVEMAAFSSQTFLILNVSLLLFATKWQTQTLNCVLKWRNKLSILIWKKKKLNNIRGQT